jgi:hypothetical protein
LLNVIGKFLPENLRAYSCCISLEDYQRARREFPFLQENEAAAIGVDQCVGGLQFLAEDLAEPKPLTLYFDKSEPFFHTIDSVWRRSRKAAEIYGGWPRQMKNIYEADHRVTYPLQAADLLARVVQRHYTRPDHEWLFLSSKLMNHHRWFLDYGRLKEFEALYGNR